MTTFPDFSLPGSDGRNHALADYQGRHLVVYFYPKDDTPGCTTEACSFRDLHSDFMRLDAAVLGVSADGLPSHQRFITKHVLPFVLLADGDHVLMDKLGVWQLKKLYGREFPGIVRSTFLVGPDGEIIREWRGVRVTGHVEEVLAAIAMLKGAGAPAPAEPMEITADPAETPPATPAPVVIPEAGGTGAAMQPLPMKAPTLAPEPAAPAPPTPTPTDGAPSAPVAPAPVAAPVVAPVAKTPTKKPSAPAKKAVAPVAPTPVAKKPVTKKPVPKKPAKPAKKVTKAAKRATKAKPAKAKSATKAKAGKSKPTKAKPAKSAKKAKATKMPAKKAKATKKPAKKR
jgi:peroxiredoxin Q/BCP